MSVIHIRDFPAAKAAREVVRLHCCRHEMDPGEVRRRVRAATRELMRGGSAGMAIVIGKQGIRQQSDMGGAA